MAVAEDRRHDSHDDEELERRGQGVFSDCSAISTGSLDSYCEELTRPPLSHVRILLEREEFRVLEHCPRMPRISENRKSAAERMREEITRRRAELRGEFRCAHRYTSTSAELAEWVLVKSRSVLFDVGFLSNVRRVRRPSDYEFLRSSHLCSLLWPRDILLYPRARESGLCRCYVL